MTNHELLDRALYASYRKQWTRSLDYAQQAVELSPENHLAYKRLSLALWHIGEHEQAIAAMEKSVALHPEFASAYYNLACFYALRDQKIEMLTNLRKAIELENNIDYGEMASQDEDFDHYSSDDDFLAATKTAASSPLNLKAIIHDSKALNEVLLSIGYDIPASAVDWDYDYKNYGISDILEKQADKLGDNTLLHLFNVATSDDSIEDLSGFHLLLKALHPVMGDDRYRDLLIDTWKERYTITDPMHLTSIDHQLLKQIKQLSPEDCAAITIWGLRLHGKDALQDYEPLIAYAIDQLPTPHDLRTTLVDLVDQYMHGDQYLHEAFDQRQQRISLALPPPPIAFSYDPKDPWASERKQLLHTHPVHIVNGARQLSIQSNQDAQQLLWQNIAKISDIITDTTLPDDVRIDAVEVLSKVGDKDLIAAVEPAINDRSIRLINAMGEMMHRVNITPKAAPATIDYLLAEWERQSDDWERYTLVEALRWLVDERIPGVLIEALDSSLEALRREALKALGLQRATVAIPHLTHQLTEGSPQCVSAAAKALHLTGEEAHFVFRDEKVYEKVLLRATKNHKWCLEALTYFELDGVSDDLLSILKTTKEFDAFPVLAKGLADRATQDLIPQLIQIGLDRYQANYIGGRFFVSLFRSIARKHHNPDPQIVEQTIPLPANGEATDLKDFIDDLNREAQHAPIQAPTKEEHQSEMRFFKAYAIAWEETSPFGRELASAMFGGGV